MQDDDKTILMSPSQSNTSSSAEGEPTYFVKDSIVIKVLQFGEQIDQDYIVQQIVRVGRAADNDIVLSFSMVSRYHLIIKRGIDGWYLQDLNSANGTFIAGEPIKQQVRLNLPVSIQFGDSACFLELSYLAVSDSTRLLYNNKNASLASAPAESFVSLSQEQFIAKNSKADHSKTTNVLSKDNVRARLLAAAESEDAGDYTKMVRSLIHEDRSKRSRKYRYIILSIIIVLAVCIGLLVNQQIAINRAKQLAIDMFYDVKQLEISLAKAEVSLEEQADKLKAKLAHLDQITRQQEEQQLTQVEEQIQQQRKKLSAMRSKYREYVKEVNSLRISLPGSTNYEEELIRRVASELGESELEMSSDFIKEVKRYIGLWKQSPRLNQAIHRLEENNYKPIILQTLNKQHISEYFLYLPLQESNYNLTAIGPVTRFGIAKGPWQFLAGTGSEFGLKTGNLSDQPIYDAQDERFNFEKASQAGAKYLKHIYSTEAQASGLLVMAAYNYGHNRVRTLIQAMPESPRERNFWKFTQQHKIPQETYDYVFYIVSAAVIGEDPKHFGFKFAPPLAAKKGIKDE